MFGTLGAPELIIIGLIVVLLFGAGRIAGFGKELGLSMKEFRKAMKDDDDEDAAPVAPLALPAAQAPADPGVPRETPPTSGPFVF